MKALLRYQLNYMRFHFIFGFVALLIIAIIFRENLFTSPERLASYVLLFTILYNYYSFLTSYEFRRVLFTLPIQPKEIIKTVYITSALFTTYISIICALFGFFYEIYYDLSNEHLIALLIVMPLTLVIMGIKNYALLRSNIEGNFAFELLVYMGTGILYGAPTITLIFSMPREYLEYYMAGYILLSITITYYTYKLSCKHADKLYVIVRNEVSEEFHESIHREMQA